MCPLRQHCLYTTTVEMLMLTTIMTWRPHPREHDVPCLTPPLREVPQKKLGDEAEVSNAAVLAAVNNLSTTIQELSAQLKINTVRIAETAKNAEFKAKEIKDFKTKTLVLEKEVTKIGTENTILKEQILELGHHKSRWNLKLCGLKEQEDENTRESVSQILLKIAPR